MRLVPGRDRGAGKLKGDEMRALDPQRSRMVLFFFLQVLFLAAFFVGIHMKVRLGVTLTCALVACLFMLLGLRAAYNLTSDSN